MGIIFSTAHCSNQKAWDKRLELEVFSDFEKQLNFHSYSPKEMNEKLHELSITGKIPDSRFKHFCMEFSLNLLENFKFYSRFSDGNFYDVKKLICLSILLGAGKNVEKISILFENYKIDDSLFLTSKQLKKMLDDLIFVAYYIIPIYVETQVEEDILRLYIANIHKALNKIIEQFIKLILGDELEVNYEGFKTSFDNNKVLVNLLSAREFRIYGNRLSSKTTEQ